MSALLTFILALLINWTLLFASSAQAGWLGDHFGHKNASQTQSTHAEEAAHYPPPSPQALEDNCGNFRRAIGKINSSSFIRQTLQIPRREWLLAHNQRCIQTTMDKEYLYLKHADIKAAGTTAADDTPSSDKATPK